MGIVSFPIHSMVIVHTYVAVYQRVTNSCRKRRYMVTRWPTVHGKLRYTRVSKRDSALEVSWRCGQTYHRLCCGMVPRTVWFTSCDGLWMMEHDIGQPSPPWVFMAEKVALLIFVCKLGKTQTFWWFITMFSGWWWLAHIWFFHILGMSSSQLMVSHIVPRGRYTSTTNQHKSQ